MLFIQLNQAFYQKQLFVKKSTMINDALEVLSTE